MTTPLEYMEKWAGKLGYRQQLGSWDTKINGIRRPDPDVKDYNGNRWADCTSSIQHAYLKATNDKVNPGYYTEDMLNRGKIITTSTNPNWSAFKPNDIVIMQWPSGYYHAEMVKNSSTLIGHPGPGAGPTTKNLRNYLSGARRWWLIRHELPTAPQTPAKPDTTVTEGKKKVSDKATYQDYRARNGGLVLKPGSSRNLAESKTAKATSASNIAKGSAGLYLATAHVYAKGNPGDVINVYFVRSDRSKKPAKGYVQYYESAVIDKRGLARVNLTNTLTKKDSNQWFFTRVLGSSKNKKDVTVTILDTDVVQL